MIYEVAGIGLRPELIANAGLTTLIGIEVLKKVIPSQVSGKEQGLAFWGPLLLGIAGSFLGVPGLAGVPLTDLAPNLLGATVAAKVSHDALSPGVDKIGSILSGLASMGKKPQ